MRKTVYFLLLIGGLLVSACQSTTTRTSDDPKSDVAGKDYFPHKAQVNYARHFTVSYHGNYKIVRTNSTLRDWGTNDQSPIEDVVVLVQRGTEPPSLKGDLARAQVIMVPVKKVAVNMEGTETYLETLDLLPGLVAVGGTKSYNDSVRARTERGELGQIGYSWFEPPKLEVLLQRKPDIFFMVLSRLSFAGSLDKSRQVGIATTPLFDWAEIDYLGRAEWIKYMALFFNEEEKANGLFATVERNVAELKQKVKDVPHKPVCAWAEFAAKGFWLCQGNNVEARLLRDAGATNPFEDFSKPASAIGEAYTVEEFLDRALNADYWILSSRPSVEWPPSAYMNGFKAWREDKLLYNHLRSKPEHNAYDWYGLGQVRPDLILADLIHQLHPDVLPHHKPVFIGNYERTTTTK
ncbi:ABC transporter substrate-binding protein [Spirosoma aerolatum]|uniref:ABC transporter substrate-binding protein n=1 Tax=Spirosoma aerolatum TaxID=1211326 RepID=UPI0009ACC0A3|nr:ABC transporter substrate-binding protein [Spirosoma aerolatum]